MSHKWGKSLSSGSMDVTPAPNIHSFLAHTTHSHSSPQERPSTTCNPNPQLQSTQKRTPEREPASRNAGALSADSTLLSTLDNTGAENKLNNFPIQCISKAAASNLRPQTEKIEKRGHLFLGAVLRASNSLSAKVKTTKFPHSILAFSYRGSFTRMSGETKTAGYFSPTVYN